MPTPKLRFNNFINCEIKRYIFNEVLKPLSVSKKKIKTQYVEKQGLYPVIDQSMSYISGYTNNNELLLSDLPVIIFGDHTCCLKYVDFPFVAGADGTKVLSLKHKGFDSKYVYYFLESSPIIPTGYNRHFSILREMNFYLPELEEQHKIAEFLSTVDEKVEALEKKLEALNSLKKGFMQKIFSQELRFKDNSGQDFPEWETKCFSEISERITRKNSNSETDIPLTISAEYGLVNQIEYFNKQIASKDLSKYFLLEKGEFAYNKSYSKGYDFGVIKRLEKYQNGALSSLYICFNVINQDCDFMTYYFDSLKWYKNMPEICQEGARNHGLLNCSVKDFFTIELELPSSKEEQRKIAEFLSAFDEKIEAVKRQVEAMKQVKKGLLQQMFV